MGHFLHILVYWKLLLIIACMNPPLESPRIADRRGLRTVGWLNGFSNLVNKYRTAIPKYPTILISVPSRIDEVNLMARSRQPNIE